MFPPLYVLSVIAPSIFMSDPQLTSARLIPKPILVTQVSSVERVTKGSPNYPLTNLAILENAFNAGISNLQVLVQGRVISLLSDDLHGDRHQRFIIELASGQTLLVAHNIDVAPRVEGLRVGDRVYVFGEYEWNERGGTLHWTHHDPDGSHVGGWIDRNGVRYE